MKAVYQMDPGQLLISSLLGPRNSRERQDEPKMSSKSTYKNMMSRTKWCWPHGVVYQEVLASEGERRNGMFVTANYCLAALESLPNKQGRTHLGDQTGSTEWKMLSSWDVARKGLVISLQLQC